MRIFANKDTRNLFLFISVIMAVFFLLSQLAVWLMYRKISVVLLLIFLLAVVSVLIICYRYFQRQEQLMGQAVSQIYAYLSGDREVRIDCDHEGEIYKLFHAVNTMMTVLNAHAENENQAREFLKGTISDISHQLKTPLAALNIYNGLLQEEAEELPNIRGFAALSEQELDRMETLVQNLLKITKLDAGSLVMERSPENIADMMRDMELHFAYRAREEQKELLLSGDEKTMLLCDRSWMMEAISNIVKNAFDHTVAGNTIRVEWKQAADSICISISDNGTGIHEEDIYYIFKRFYRSRFSKDTQGIGLGLPIAKAIVEAHGGTLTADSIYGEGSIFVLRFVNPTKL